MSAVLPSKEFLERDYLSFEASQGPRPLNLVYLSERTSSSSTLTHIRMPNGKVIKPEHMPQLYGFSYDQWRLIRAELPDWHLRPEAVHIELGGIALSLDAFEASHKHINLGHE